MKSQVLSSAIFHNIHIISLMISTNLRLRCGGGGRTANATLYHGKGHVIAFTLESHSRFKFKQDTVTVRSLIRENLHDKETFMRCAKFNAPAIWLHLTCFVSCKETNSNLKKLCHATAFFFES